MSEAFVDPKSLSLVKSNKSLFARVTMRSATLKFVNLGDPISLIISPETDRVRKS
jgi:hypothetical protein